MGWHRSTQRQPKPPKPRAARCWVVPSCPCSDRNQERTDMIIRKKPARQHGLHEPFRHENHPRPITRRQLMGAGFLSGPAFVLAPAWLGALLKTQRADGVPLDGDIDTLRKACMYPMPAGGGGAVGTT